MSFIEKPEQIIFIFLALFVVFYLAYFIRIFILVRRTRSRLNPIFYKFFLRLSYFSLIIIALLGPSFGVSKKEIPIREKEIFIAIDLSRSMMVNDIQPNRFEKVRSEIKKIIEGINEAKFGLIIFTTEAFLHTPLTSDKTALNTYLDILNPNLIEAKGTALEAPIELTINKFKEANTSANASISKILILATDGQDFSKKTIRTVKDAAEENIRIYPIGIGTSGGKELISEGKTVNSSLNKKELQNIASITGGNYFEISNKAEETNLLIKNVNDLREEKIKDKKASSASNKYFYFLLPALLLMLADILITLNIIKI